MNEQVSTTATTWALPVETPALGRVGSGRGDQDVAEWKTLVNQVALLATQNGWNKAEVARRADMPDGTFSQWFSAKYTGRLDEQNKRIQRWLDSVEEMGAMGRNIPQAPAFFENRTSREVIETLLYAQVVPEFVTITLGAGIGKTAACEHFQSARPHAFLATMSPNTRTTHGMLVELAGRLGVQQPNPAKLHRSIGDRLQRNGKQTLLIVDEAQNLTGEAIDQLRNLFDIYKCGIALVGNDEVHNRFKAQENGPSYAQLRRRVGKRLRRASPYPEDIAASITAWGITDEGSRRFLTGVGNKHGALGQIDKTMKLACLLAAGDDSPVTERHIRAAWANRNVED